MVKITEELIRKRAEHNEGCISNLEEVALHQFEIEKIENLDKLCRHLRILYLQNNIIDKMENLSKLKELDYLNLALNNIDIIEGLEGCESLRKLDLTANFVNAETIKQSLEHLQKVPSIKELYLLGNPITEQTLLNFFLNKTSWDHYRELVIAMVDHLESLDGKEIIPSERIAAKQNLNDLLIDLESHKEIKRIEKKQKEQQKQQEKLAKQNNPSENNQEEEEKGLQNQLLINQIVQKKKTKKVEYTKESRREMYLEIAKEKEEQERKRHPEKFQEKKPPTSIYKSTGDMRQCNEGKYEFKMREFDDPEWSYFDLHLPKFLDTSLVDAQLFPQYVSVRVKGKLTQLKLNEEVIVEQSSIQRSQVTGILTFKMKKVNYNEVLSNYIDREKQQKAQEQKEKEEEKVKKQNVKKDFFGNEIAQEKKPITKTYDETTFKDKEDDDLPDLE